MTLLQAARNKRMTNFWSATVALKSATLHQTSTPFILSPSSQLWSSPEKEFGKHFSITFRFRRNTVYPLVLRKINLDLNVLALILLSFLSLKLFEVIFIKFWPIRLLENTVFMPKNCFVAAWSSLFVEDK